MDPRTKAEATMWIQDYERRAAKCDQLASWQRKAHKREHEENAARHHRKESARLRALLHTLPD